MDDGNDIPLRSDSHRQHRIRQEQTLEAEILPNDTLISIALRFNCTVADIKRLNKIDKDNEIFAYKVLKVPLTAHNILLDTLPKVHTSGSSRYGSNDSKRSFSNTLIHFSPQTSKSIATTSNDSQENRQLEEKLLLASVSNAVIAKADGDDVNGNRRLHDDELIEDSHLEENSRSSTISEPLLKKSHFRGYPRTIPPRNDFLTFNGSDCELNWICLLLVILAFCVIVPLIYVALIYEHPEKFNHTHSKYDDPELHKRF